MKKKGSITIFLALLLTCFFSAVFAFLEAARVSGLSANSQISTAQAGDTVLASYNRDLWENYHLMFWEADDEEFPDLDSLESLQQSAVEGNLTALSQGEDNYYVLQVHLTEVNPTAYQLVTDDGGMAFRKQAAEMMKDTVAENAVQSMLGWISGEDTSEEKDLGDEAIEVLETLESAAEGSTRSEDAAGGNTADSGESSSQTAISGSADGESSAGNQTSSSEVEVEITENPLEWVKKMKKNGILAIVIPDSDISQNLIDLDSCIEKRTLQTGTLTTSDSMSATEKILFYLYLAQYFSDASEDADDRALAYELEYMIAGKSGDQSNLKAVVRRLLLMREAANFAYLESDSAKQQEAAAMAAALTAVVALPELEPLVQQGLLAAWAYAESISDVRILLEGGKVSLVKTADQWHTELGSLTSSVYAVEGSEQTKGLSYENYLEILMWMTSDEKLSERAMDMIEKNHEIVMDQMICRVECEYTYEASPLFWNFVNLGQNSFGTLQFTDQATISFME
ncbi:MAG: DUF5702 domain-containing protein [Clostridiales bacterium]|nr:DUF5702 domain-containing protein [Clostridiales bacterium]